MGCQGGDWIALKSCTDAANMGAAASQRTLQCCLHGNQGYEQLSLLVDAKNGRISQFLAFETLPERSRKEIFQRILQRARSWRAE